MELYRPAGMLQTTAMQDTMNMLKSNTVHIKIGLDKKHSFEDARTEIGQRLVEAKEFNSKYVKYHGYSDHSLHHYLKNSDTWNLLISEQQEAGRLIIFENVNNTARITFTTSNEVRYELIDETMGKTQLHKIIRWASSNTSKSEKDDYDKIIYDYVSSSNEWTNITDEQGDWDDVTIFINSNSTCRVIFMCDAWIRLELLK